MIVYNIYFAFSHCGTTMDLLQKFKWLYRISFLFFEYYYFGFLQFLANQTEFLSCIACELVLDVVIGESTFRLLSGED